jgi:hypothetical protein
MYFSSSSTKACLLLSDDKNFGGFEFPLVVVQCLRITSQAPSQVTLQDFDNSQSSPADDNNSSLGMW